MAYAYDLISTRRAHFKQLPYAHHFLTIIAYFLAIVFLTPTIIVTTITLFPFAFLLFITGLFIGVPALILASPISINKALESGITFVAIPATTIRT